MAGSGVVDESVVSSGVAPAVNGVSEGAGEPAVEGGVVVVGAGVSASVADGIVDVVSAAVVVVVVSPHTMKPKVVYGEEEFIKFEDSVPGFYQHLSNGGEL